VLRKAHTSITRSRVAEEAKHSDSRLSLSRSRLRCRGWQYCIVLYVAGLRCRSGLSIFYEFLTSFLSPRVPHCTLARSGGRCSIIDGNGVFPTVTSLGRRLSFESMRCNTIILGPGLGLRVSVGTSQLSATGLTQDLDSRQLGGCPSRLHVPRQKQSFPSQYTRTCRMLACRQSSHCPVLHRDIPEKKNGSYILSQ
jgi:hypothetical protein